MLDFLINCDFVSVGRLKKNLEYEEQNREKKHTRRHDYGSEFELSVDASGLMVAEEGVASAGNCAHSIVFVAALHQNDGDHRDSGENEKYHKHDTEYKVYVRRGGRRNKSEHYNQLLKVNNYFC